MVSRALKIRLDDWENRLNRPCVVCGRQGKNYPYGPARGCLCADCLPVHYDHYDLSTLSLLDILHERFKTTKQATCPHPATAALAVASLFALIDPRPLLSITHHRFLLCLIKAGTKEDVAGSNPPWYLTRGRYIHPPPQSTLKTLEEKHDQGQVQLTEEEINQNIFHDT